MFQSARPVWDAILFSWYTLMHENVSIRASRVGRDGIRHKYLTICEISGCFRESHVIYPTFFYSFTDKLSKNSLSGT